MNSKQVAKKLEKLSDLKLDTENANRHTMRGMAMIEESLTRLGAGRSVLADRNGKLIAGNGTVEVAQGIGAEDIIVVPTDGTKLVVVQRTDLDLDTDEKARQLAFVDNRSAQVGLEWDPAVLKSAQERGNKLDWMFRTDELEQIFGDDKKSVEFDGDDDKPGDGGKSKKDDSPYTLTLVFDNAQQMKDAASDLEAQGYRFKRGVL